MRAFRQACLDEEPGASRVNELPSVALTRRFLALCEKHGSQRLAVRLVAGGRNSGVPGLPGVDDWTAWDAEQMRVGGRLPGADAHPMSRQFRPGSEETSGPQDPEGITRIGEGVVIEGEVKGGENLVIDGKVDGTNRAAGNMS